MQSNPHSVIYAEGTFDIANPTPSQLQAMQAAAQDLGTSGFGTVILAFLHVHDGGELYYNDTPFSEVLGFLPGIVSTIKANGTVTRVLLSVGPNAGDFAHIQADLSGFESAFSTLVGQLGVDGLDIDLEEDYETYLDLLTELVPWLVGQGLTVTAAPYQETSFWTKLLSQTNVDGNPAFAWWNLQTYGGASYPEWVHLLTGLVPNSESFLVPGYSAPDNPQAPPTTPSQLEGTLASLVSIYPSLNGATMWQYELIGEAGYTATEYATAISTALGAASTVSAGG